MNELQERFAGATKRHYDQVIEIRLPSERRSPFDISNRL